MRSRPIKLGDAALAALGAGRPDAATLDTLRRAQLSRNMLLLREIRRRHPDTPSWYPRITAAEPAEARRLIADPMTGLSAAEALRAGDHESFELPEPGLVLTAVHQDLSLSVRVDAHSRTRSRLGLPPTGELTAAELDHWQHCLDEAWRILVSRHRPAAEVLAAVLRVIVPVLPDPAAEGISATSSEAFGAVAMSAPADPAALAVGLLHETMHSVLNAVTLLFDLVRPGGSAGYSPWRDDPRPAAGVLHGAYAYLAVTRFWRTELAAAATVPAVAETAGPAGAVGTAGAVETAGAVGTAGAAKAGGSVGTAGAVGAVGADGGAAFEFARWRVAVAEAAEALLEGGELTPAGARFVAALLGEVRPWRDEEVDGEAVRLAGLVRDDHYLRWRLRNLTVSPEHTAELARAWREGRPAPRVPSIPAVGSGRALENSPRVRLAHALVKKAGLGDASPGDAAVVRGDARAALPAYQIDLEKNRDQDLSWAGLALVSPRPALRSRPEVVKAAAIALPEAEIDALADWLAG
ncbi:hypothetical protein ACTI_29750 [Actinoplanes sp. OR16]|uniref:aKG-HExxH-type peptide beta-hydroxylase n=1 Tax=Actinoplanes sp. OR16 TaxID=946334 RepID=UPI000F71A46B|nr:HEXXH motif-containing putative peptide modification protein [Actinoplanes sp. OR16]BBH66290.1 hypothetical protein ACTI_29750 [Actinoplanes sp. OR16]